MKPLRNRLSSYFATQRGKHVLTFVMIFFSHEKCWGNAPQGLRQPGTASNPSFRLKLTLAEYSLINAAEVDGLQTYGGSADFKVIMAKEGNEVNWTLTIENPRVLELLRIFVGEKTVRIVQGVDPNNIDPSEKAAFTAIKSLSQQLEYAQKNPIWPIEKVVGTVAEHGTNWVIQSADETLRVTGPQLDGLKREKGKPVVADGFVKVPGELEMADYFEQKTNTLEVFVMSLCPFGQRAETNLLSYLQRAGWNDQGKKPALEIHYIFYKTSQNGGEVFTALHGEAELRENLVQILIRERFPKIFFDYIRLRAATPDAEWRRLAAGFGISAADLAEIEKTIETDRDSIIQKEFEYARSRYEITDGSPSFVWEGRRVKNLEEIEAFKGLDSRLDGGCSNPP